LVARKALIDRIVKAELEAARIDEPPVDLDFVARRHAYRIVRGTTLPAGVRARFRRDWGEIAVVDLGPVVERFAIAHELGHALLDHGDRSCYELEPAADAVPLDEADVGVSFEAEANAFAGRLLVPGRWLRAAVADGYSPDQLQALFQVTKPVLWIAIERERLISKIQGAR
jgi:hypothetical protein